MSKCSKFNVGRSFLKRTSLVFLFLACILGLYQLTTGKLTEKKEVPSSQQQAARGKQDNGKYSEHKENNRGISKHHSIVKIKRQWRKDYGMKRNDVKTHKRKFVRQFVKKIINGVVTYECRCMNTSTPNIDFENMLNIYEKHPFENGTHADFLLRRHPNIGNILLSNKMRCELIPSITEINWNGMWQLTEQSTADKHHYYIYSTSCDRNQYGFCTNVRIITQSSRDNPTRMYCYIWTSMSSNPMVVLSETPIPIGWKEIRLKTHLVTCKPPRPIKAIAVSLSKYPCAYVNNLVEIGSLEMEKVSKIENAYRENKFNISSGQLLISSSIYDVAVCGPAIFHMLDISRQLIEWLEILKLLDVKLVVIYRIRVHPNVDKVLRYYETEGFMKVISFIYPSPYNMNYLFLRSWTKHRDAEYFGTETSFYTDCILRMRSKYRFLMHIDPDEIPILGNFTSISKFVEDQLLKFNHKPVNIRFPSRVFPLNIPPGRRARAAPKGFFFIRRNQSPFKFYQKPSAIYKTIFDTHQTVAVNSHYAENSTGVCNFTITSVKDHIYLAHFRKRYTKKFRTKDFWVENFLIQFTDKIVSSVRRISNLLVK